MAPKSSSGKEKAIEGQEEEVLQAVILADSFNKRFKPLTVNKPRCLLPVCNVPLLDWTFEALALAGVQEIFVICRSHADQVKAAIRNSKWSHPRSGIKIVPVVTAKEAFSAGDAMRDIYTHGIITSDFVLVSGDLVSSVRIDEVVRAHKERRKTNKDAIMTMVVKEAGVNHRTRPRGETSVFVLDAETSECLHYEAVQGYPPKTHARIPREILNEHPDVEVRNDFIDCFIDVCSVEVPSLFQDNFDYQDIRRDFVHGVLTSDLLMKNIYCHVVSEGYAARVKDTKSYASVSKDILSRWSFPLVPDNNLPGSSTTVYEHLRGNKYFSRSSPPQLARTSHVGPLTLLGPDVSISQDARVWSSVLGANCIVGQGSVVSDSYLWDDVQIEAGCVVEGSILGRGVKVLKGSRIERGCLVADGVVVGPDARLRRLTRVSTKRAVIKRPAEEGEESDDEDEDSELEDIEEAQTPHLREPLGPQSNGVVWPDEAQESEDEDDDAINSRLNQRLLRLGESTSDLDLSDAGSVTSSSDSEDESDDDGIPFVNGNISVSSSSSALPISALAVAALDAQAEKEFQAEVHASLARAFAEGHSVDNAAVELKTLRMSTNVPLSRVREAVIAGIVELIPLVSNAIEQRKEIARVVDRWGALINKIGGVDPVETITALQEHSAQSPRLTLFGQILSALYQADIVDEDDIRAWHDLPESKGKGSGATAENMRRCWTVGSRMIQQFDEQDDESEEEGDSDAESESEEEEDGSGDDDGDSEEDDEDSE